MLKSLTDVIIFIYEVSVKRFTDHNKTKWYVHSSSVNVAKTAELIIISVSYLRIAWP